MRTHPQSSTMTYTTFGAEFAPTVGDKPKTSEINFILVPKIKDQNSSVSHSVQDQRYQLNCPLIPF